MNTTIGISEQAYLDLIAEKEKLQKKVDRYELFLYGVLRQADKMIKDEQDDPN